MLEFVQDMHYYLSDINPRSVIYETKNPILNFVYKELKATAFHLSKPTHYKYICTGQYSHCPM